MHICHLCHPVSEVYHRCTDSLLANQRVLAHIDSPKMTVTLDLSSLSARQPEIFHTSKIPVQQSLKTVVTLCDLLVVTASNQLCTLVSYILLSGTT